MSREVGTNLLLTIAYDGTSYVGWQRQPNWQGISVQQRLEEALAKVLRHPVSINGAGRTDAGVHALGQTCTFCCDKPVPLNLLPTIVNHQLPPDIRVLAAEAKAADFHARFSAVGKHYRYLMERDAAPSPFTGRFTWQLEQEPDVALMRQGAELLVGEHDFRHFTLSACETKTFTRRIGRLELLEPPESEGFPWQALSRPLVLEVEGNGFLYKMVRIITGRLLAVGLHKLSLAELAGFLDGSCERNIPPAPARGLTLVSVKY